MKRNTFSTRFFIRTKKLRKNGFAPLFLRLTINGKRWDSSLRISLRESDWDSKRGLACGTDRNSILVNETIESTFYRLHKIKLAVEDEGGILDIDTVKSRFVDKERNQKTILKLFQKHNKDCEKRVGIQITNATFVRYKTCYSHFSEFLRSEYKVDDLPLSEVNRGLYEKFECFLKGEKKCAHNTTIKYIKNFNKIVRIAVENGWLTKSPYKEIGYRLEDIEKPYLTAEDLKAIINKEISINRLEIIRDIFIFCCYTGLAFSDIKELSEDNIQVGIDKKKWIIKNRKKTNTVSKIPLLDVPAQIIDKYRDYPKSSLNGSLLPVPSNQKMNAYLKEIADLSGIHKVLTTHTARRTFATTIMLHNGVNMEAVSKMLGHTSLYMTRKYAKADELYIATETKKVREIYKVAN